MEDNKKKRFIIIGLFVFLIIGILVGYLFNWYNSGTMLMIFVIIGVVSVLVFLIIKMINANKLAKSDVNEFALKSTDEARDFISSWLLRNGLIVGIVSSVRKITIPAQEQKDASSFYITELVEDINQTPYLIYVPADYKPDIQFIKKDDSKAMDKKELIELLSQSAKSQVPKVTVKTSFDQFNRPVEEVTKPVEEQKPEPGIVENGGGKQDGNILKK
jgi:hypothetical protein